MHTPFLTYPDAAYRDSFLAALREFHAEGLHREWNEAAITSHFENFVESLRKRETTFAPGLVPESYYWLIVNGVFVGRVSVRHTLNASLRVFGGHIGYEIRPSFRRQGYGRLIAQLGLEKARALGLRRVLITCDDTNTASARIIESVGGVLQDTIRVKGRTVPTRRYWVALGEPRGGTDG